ncbi:very-long-chain 3-oxoacyl-CoA reductase [Anabrus simplex]|uniref:very-long-chain 3-oxoacyl-CoA reductase n=1 Tax=Anabrus simplex TaxID=316456 RepID=UPI0034DDB0A0
MDKVGIICVSLIGLHIVKSVINLLYFKWIAPAFGLNANLKEMGGWAVVTGATDGVGKAFAFACAKRGLDVVLISRNVEKLGKVAAEIEERHKVNTKIIEADFSDSSSEAYHKIAVQLCGLDIGVLINNVGVSYVYPEYFLDVPEKEKVYSNIIQCNIFPVTFMTNIALQRMVEKRKGVIINIASTAAKIPSPLLTVYGASKAYVEKFSEDLAYEYGNRGIIVQCLVPGYVATKMSRISKPTWMAPSPEDYVESALSSTGLEGITTGYFPHTLLVSTIKAMKSISPRFATWVIKNIMENIRNRALLRNAK